MKKISTCLLTIALLLGFGLVQADDSARIQNFVVAPVDNGKQLSLKWTLLASDGAAKVEGYALQWSDKESEMQTDDEMRLHFDKDGSSTYIRAANFEKNKIYYFRVYSYYDGVSKRIYNSSESSEIMKWTWISRNTANSEFITPTDPVIVDNGVSDADGFPDEDFGVLRAMAFDRSVQLLWSNSNLASSEFDGHRILVSASNDFSTPLVTMDANRMDRKAYLEGLDPNTTYYAKAAFYKTSNGSDHTFGESPVINFKTAEAFTGRQLSSFNRTLDRMRKAGLGKKFKVGGTSSSTTDTSTTTTATSATPVKSSTSDTKDTSSIRARIRAIKAEIVEREKEITRLEKMLGTSTTSSRNTSSTRTSQTTTSTKKMSLRERMLARLGR
jgi:hypothetical protein